MHNDLTHYDTTVSHEIREFLRGNPVARQRLVIDLELEEALRLFKAESPAEIECRRDMLRYKRRIDDVVREWRGCWRRERRCKGNAVERPCW